MTDTPHLPGPLHYCFLNCPQLCRIVGDSAAPALHPVPHSEPRCAGLDCSTVPFLCGSAASDLIHHQALWGSGLCHPYDHTPVLLYPALKPCVLDIPVMGPVVSPFSFPRALFAGGCVSQGLKKSLVDPTCVPLQNITTHNLLSMSSCCSLCSKQGPTWPGSDDC